MKSVKDMLLVEDGKENIESARNYFENIDEINLHVATTYNEGLKEIRNNVYGIGIFDFHLPKDHNSEPSPLGHLLVKEAIRNYIPMGMLATSGIDHHNSYGTQTFDFGNFEFEDRVGVQKKRTNFWSDIYEEISESWMYADEEMVKEMTEHKIQNGGKKTLENPLTETVFDTIYSKLGKGIGFKDYLE